MYRSALLVTVLLISTTVAIADDTTPISPSQAAKKVNEKVVVEMEVKSSGGNKNQYLNSEDDYKDNKNFTIFIAKDHLDKFKKAGIENPSLHFKGKVIRVTGIVVLEQQKPRINVDDPERIQIVSKDKK